MTHLHAVIWLDKSEARIFDFSADDVHKTVVHPDKPSKHLRHKTGAAGSGQTQEDVHYYDEIAKAVSGAGEILVVGPGQAKLAFIKHVHKHHLAIEPKVVGVETVDHPSDGQLVAYARKYFVAKDRMLAH